MAPGIDGLGQIAIPVRDVARATAFYRDVLGLRFLFAAEPSMAFFDCGGVRLMLSVSETPELQPPGSVLYYRVADLERSAASLRASGVTFEREPHLVARMRDHELHMAFLRDTEGNFVALMSEVRR